MSKPLIPTSDSSEASPSSQQAMAEGVTGIGIVDMTASEAEEAEEVKRDRAGFWRVFFSTFGAIFLAELGDKTQVATLLMSAESGNPWIVFLGAGTALVMTSLIGVALGRWLARKVSPHTLDTGAGIVLLAITVGLLWDVIHG